MSDSKYNKEYYQKNKNKLKKYREKKKKKKSLYDKERKNIRIWNCL